MADDGQRRQLVADGWRPVRERGSHGLLKQPAKDINIATLRSIYRQAGWDWQGRN